MKFITTSAIAIVLAAVVQAENPTPPMLADFDKETGHVLITEAGKPILNYNYHNVLLPEGITESK